MGAGTIAFGLPVAMLLVAVLAMWLDERGASLAAPVPSEQERALAVRGCRGCALASEAGDDFLRRHLDRECAA